MYGHYSHQERLITDPAIRSFSGWSEITEHTKAANGESLDQELAAAVRFVEKHGYNTTSVLDRIVDSAGSPQETAVSFSTVHRAKGLEWPFVTMLDDFPSKRNEKGKIEIPSRGGNESVICRCDQGLLLGGNQQHGFRAPGPAVCLSCLIARGRARENGTDG